MVVEELHISSFGKLNNFDLKFSDGLNIIYGKNEAGKSTILAFIKAMLYSPGRSSSDPSKSDRTRYSSWDSNAFGGTLTVTHNSKRYIISKNFVQKGSKDIISVIDAFTGKECDDIPKDSIGEHFLGVGEEAFENSVFVKQLSSRMKSAKSKELSDKLINLSQSGNENISVLTALDYLNEHKRIFEGTNRAKGRIDQLRDALSDFKAELNRTQELRSTEMEHRTKLRDLLEEQQQVSEKLTSIKEKKSSIKLSDEYNKYTELKKLIDDKSAEITNHCVQLDVLRNKGFSIAKERGNYYPFSSDEEIELTVNEKRIQEIKDLIINAEKAYFEAYSRFKKQLCYPAIILFALAAIMLIVTPFIKTTGIILSVLFLCIGVGYYIAEKKFDFGFRHDRLDTKELNDELHVLKTRNVEILQNAHVESLDDYKTLRKENEAYEHALAQVQTKIEYEEATIAQLREEYNELYTEFNDRYSGKAPNHSENEVTEEEYNKLDALYTELNERAIELVGLIKDLQIYIEKYYSNIRDVSQITEDIENTERELKECESELVATSIAISTFKSCVEKMQMEFGPVLNKLAGEYIYILSDGKYNNLKISDNFEIMFQEYSNGMYYNAAYLSEGALDMAYLALRLAIMNIVFKNTKVPVFLDDVFNSYDDERAQIAIEFLHKLSEKNQIILLSCQKRDTIISNDNIDVNLISL